MKLATKRYISFAVLMLALLPILLSACSHSTKRETTSVIREEPATLSDDSAPASMTPKTVIIEKTETITETDESCGGILSCTVDVVGAVIALPFKAVGFLIDVIF